MLQITAQLPFSAKFFSTNSPPPKKSSNRVREYLRLDEVLAMSSLIKRHRVVLAKQF